MAKSVANATEEPSDTRIMVVPARPAQLQIPKPQRRSNSVQVAAIESISTSQSNADRKSELDTATATATATATPVDVAEPSAAPVSLKSDTSSNSAIRSPLQALLVRIGPSLDDETQAGLLVHSLGSDTDRILAKDEVNAASGRASGRALGAATSAAITSSRLSEASLSQEMAVETGAASA